MTAINTNGATNASFNTVTNIHRIFQFFCSADSQTGSGYSNCITIFWLTFLINVLYRYKLRCSSLPYGWQHSPHVHLLTFPTAGAKVDCSVIMTHPQPLSFNSTTGLRRLFFSSSSFEDVESKGNGQQCSSLTCRTKWRCGASPQVSKIHRQPRLTFKFLHFRSAAIKKRGKFAPSLWKVVSDKTAWAECDFLSSAEVVSVGDDQFPLSSLSPLSHPFAAAADVCDHGAKNQRPAIK